MTELQLLEAKLIRERDLVDEALENGVIQEEEHQRRMRAIEQRGEQSRTAIKEKGEKARKAIMSGALSSMFSSLSGSSKKMFKVQKAAALAQASVAVPASVTEAIKNAGGLPFGAWAGALTLAKGVAEIAAIKRQSFGGAGGVSSSAGGGSSSQAASIGRAAGLPDQSVGSQFSQQNQQAAPQRIVNVNISGDVVGDTAETILGKMRTLIEENDAVLFSSNSRQAAELVPAGG